MATATSSPVYGAYRVVDMTVEGTFSFAIELDRLRQHNPGCCVYNPRAYRAAMIVMDGVRGKAFIFPDGRYTVSGCRTAAEVDTLLDYCAPLAVAHRVDAMVTGE